MVRYSKKRPTIAELAVIGRTGKRQKQLVHSNDVSAMLPVVCSRFDDDSSDMNSFCESGNALVGATVIHLTNTKELLARSEKLFNHMNFLTPEVEKRVDYDRKLISGFFSDQKNQFRETLKQFRREPSSWSLVTAQLPHSQLTSDEPDSEFVEDNIDQVSFQDSLDGQSMVIDDKNIYRSAAFGPHADHSPIRQPYSPLTLSLSREPDVQEMANQGQLDNPNEPFDFNNESLLRQYDEYSEVGASNISLLNRLTAASDLVTEPLEEQLFVRSSGTSSESNGLRGDVAVENAESVGNHSIRSGRAICDNSVGSNSIGRSRFCGSRGNVDTSPARILLYPVEIPQIISAATELEDSPLRALTRRLLQRTNETKTKDLTIIEWTAPPEEPQAIRKQRSAVDVCPLESYREHDDSDWLIRNYLVKRPRRKRKQRTQRERKAIFDQEYHLHLEKQYQLWGPVANLNSRELSEIYLRASKDQQDSQEVREDPELDIEMSDNMIDNAKRSDAVGDDSPEASPRAISSFRRDQLLEIPQRIINNQQMTSLEAVDSDQGQSGDSESVDVSIENQAGNGVSEILENYNAGSNDFNGDAYGDVVQGIIFADGGVSSTPKVDADRNELDLRSSDADVTNNDGASDSWNETGFFRNAPTFEFNSFDRLPRLLAAGSMVNHPHPYEHDPLSDVRELASEEIADWHRVNEEKLSEDFFNDLTEFIRRALETSMRISFERFYHAVSRAHQGKVRPHLYLYALTFIAQQQIIELTQSVHTQQSIHSQIVIEKLVV